MKETDLAQSKRNDLVSSRNQVDNKPTLNDLNIDKTQSHRCQTMAELPEAAYTISRGTAWPTGTPAYPAELPPPSPQLYVAYPPQAPTAKPFIQPDGNPVIGQRHHH